MNQQSQTKSVICKSDEYRENLLSAINSALRWYVLTRDKRSEDDQDALLFLDLIEELKER
jgi:hypothetical protein